MKFLSIFASIVLFVIISACSHRTKETVVERSLEKSAPAGEIIDLGSSPSAPSSTMEIQDLRESPTAPPSESSSDMPLEEVHIMAYRVELKPAAASKSMPLSEESSETRVESLSLRKAESRARDAKKVFSKSEKDGIPESVLDKEDPAKDPNPTPEPKAGLLTAGEWNDLNNWATFWMQQWKDGEITPYATMYGIFPKSRFSVILSNNSNFPAVDVPVLLKNKQGDVLWKSKTDNTGKAELWANLFENKENAVDLAIFAEINGKLIDLGSANQARNTALRKTLDFPCASSKTVDILWVVDATGSMGDEIDFLKSELQDVMGRAKALQPELTFRMGSVFYRDVEDAYLVRSSVLSPDLSQTLNFIKKQKADGGGDYPEAVDAAMEEAIFRQPWSASATARICFLVLDASPHETPESNQRIQRAIRSAAEKGIRIVPIAASGVQKDTEYLMKMFGIATNGSYVFLTDDSGIGGKHLAPTVEEYKVELLNALLLRIITEYSTVPTCAGKSVIRFEKDPSSLQNTAAWNFKYWPNPATDVVTLDLPTAVEGLDVFNAEGKLVHQMQKLDIGAHRLVVSGFSPGVYMIRIRKNGQHKTGKLVVVRN